MSSTTFSGPVTSLNGFISGTASAPVAVTTAGNINAAYATTSATSGDTRLVYDKLTFTGAGGAGETLRAFSVVSVAGAAVGGTINGAHISAEVDGTGTISGAANALRATIGGTSAAPGGTLSAIQADSNFTGSVTLPATTAFIRFSDSGTSSTKVPNLFNLSAANLLTTGTASVAGGIKIRINGTTYYLLVSSSAPA
jgi:hypothetical protein